MQTARHEIAELLGAFVEGLDCSVLYVMLTVEVI